MESSVQRKPLVLFLDETSQESFTEVPSPIKKVEIVKDRALKRPREEPVIQTSRKRRRLENLEKARILLKEANKLSRNPDESQENLTLAIQKYKEAFHLKFDDEWLKSVILLSWGQALVQRDLSAEERNADSFDPYKGRADLDEAFARFHEGLVRLRTDPNLDARFDLELAKADLKKAQITGNSEHLRLSLQFIHSGMLQTTIPDVRGGLLKTKGNVYEEMKEYAKAKECYEEALAIEGLNEFLKANLEGCLQSLYFLSSKGKIGGLDESLSTLL